MSEPTVLYDDHDAIAVITLNRPDKLNAPGDEPWQDYGQQADNADT